MKKMTFSSIYSYDEAYMDMYGASDRLQYGDCFSTDFNSNNNNTSVNIDVIDATDATNTANMTDTTDKVEPALRTSSLDARIDQALKNTSENILIIFFRFHAISCIYQGRKINVKTLCFLTPHDFMDVAY